MLKSLDSINKIDWVFIREMNDRFPNRQIAINVERYLNLPQGVRLEQAFTDAQSIERSGYVKREFPVDVRQKLSDHLYFTGELASFMGGNDAYHSDLKHYGQIHDIPEVIATDFTPHDPISPDEKFGLENISARVIFSDEDYALWHGCERGEGDIPQLAREFDALEMPFHCLVAEFKHPSLRQQVDEFWNYTARKVKHPLSKWMCDRLSGYRQEIQESGWLTRTFHDVGKKVVPGRYSTHAMKGRYIRRMYHEMSQSYENMMSGAS